jgi:enamine deaminase RidA (YjgF/YER057c/UK114 family)
LLALELLGFFTEDPRMSKIVIHNGVVYLSGLTDTSDDSIEGQTRKVLAKVDILLDILLEQAGTSKSNLLTASIWLKDIGTDFKAMNGVWNEWLDPNNKPVRATVQAPMARPQILVEVQVTAAQKND